MRRSRVAVATALGAALALVTVVVAPTRAGATWADDATATQVLGTASLQPPTSPVAVDGACVILTSASIVVTWSATPSTFAAGYEVHRATASAGPYSLVGTVGGRAVTTFTDPNLPFTTTYWYVVRAVRGGWTSTFTAPASQATPTALCV